MPYEVTKQRAEREAANFNAVNGNSVTRYVAIIALQADGDPTATRWAIMRQIRWVQGANMTDWVDDGWVWLDDV